MCRVLDSSCAGCLSTCCVSNSCVPYCLVLLCIESLHLWTFSRCFLPSRLCEDAKRRKTEDTSDRSTTPSIIGYNRVRIDGLRAVGSGTEAFGFGAPPRLGCLSPLRFTVA